MNNTVSTSVSPPPTSGAALPRSYPLKTIPFGAENVTICMQTNNGPCSFLSLANALILTHRLTIPASFLSVQNIPESALLQLMGSFYADSVANKSNMEFALAEVIDLLPTLVKGLDINVSFADVNKFEYDRAVSAFDLAGINLYHGWTVDVNDPNYAWIAPLTFNALMNIVISNNDQTNKDIDDSIRLKAEAANEFLQFNASQLTFHGLTRLHEVCKVGEVCVFFRNNHFSTMYKHDDGKLYLLCTDLSFRDKRHIAWYF